MTTEARKRLVVGLVCLPLLAGFFSYLAGVIFVALVWKGQMPLQVTPLTIFRYLAEYGHAQQLRFPFAVSLGPPGLILLALSALLLFYRPRPTLYGDGRWANRSELVKAKMLDSEGVILGELGGDLITAHPEHHIEVAAPTGGGKGVSIAIPNLLVWPGSVVVNDIKGENFEMTSKFRALCGQEVYVFNPSDAQRRTHRWNPFFYVDRDPMLRGKGIQRIAAMLWPPAEDKGEPFKPGARGLFTTLSLWHLENEIEPTLASVAMMGATLDEKAIKEKVQARQGTDAAYSAEVVSGFAEFFNLPDKFRESVRGEFSLGLEIVTKDPLLRLATSGNDFDVRLLRKRPISIYVVTPGPDLGRLRPLLNLFFQQIGAENTDIEFGLDAEHKHQAMMMLDEFTSLGDLSSVVDPIAYYRSYGLKLVTIYQSQSQVEGLYGKERSSTFKENHKTRVVFTPATMDEAKRVSEELPKTTSYSISKSGKKLESKSISHNEAARALMLPDEVKLLPDDEAIIFPQGISPVRIKKLRYYENPLMLARLRSVSPMLAGIRGKPAAADFKAARRAGELAVEIPALALPVAQSAAAATWGKDAEPVFRPPTAEDVATLHERDLADFKIDGIALAPPPVDSTAEEKKAYAKDVLAAMFGDDD